MYIYKCGVIEKQSVLLVYSFCNSSLFTSFFFELSFFHTKSHKNHMYLKY